MVTPNHGSNVDRKIIPAQYKWKTSDIYATREDWEKACSGLKELIIELEKCQGSLKEKSTAVNENRYLTPRIFPSFLFC